MERDNPGITRGAGIDAPDTQHDPTAHLGSGMRNGGAEGFVGDGLSWQAAAPALPSAATAPRRRPRRGQQFVPTVLYGSIWYMLAIFIALVILALTSPAPLDKPADPLNRALYIPRPEWYFLFLFQVLKIFQGPWELVGTVVVPGIATVILLALPFYDRNWHKRPAKRPLAMASATLAVVGLLWLTWWSQGNPLPFAGQSAPAVAAGGGGGGAASSGPTYASVYQIFNNSCAQCHFAGGSAVSIINLSKYQNLFTGGHTGGPWPGPVVVKGDHKKSYLWRVISGLEQPAMPLGGNKLAQGDIDTIAQWIDQGAKEK